MGLKRLARTRRLMKRAIAEDVGQTGGEGSALKFSLQLRHFLQ